jgi:hypothetical protein
MAVFLHYGLSWNHNFRRATIASSMAQGRTLKASASLPFLGILRVTAYLKDINGVSSM